MPNFFMLRGAPGCGKSTWVHDNDLDDITVSSDEFRLQLVGTDIDENGDEKISQGNPGLVWGRIHDELRRRMAAGEDVILDSTALRSRDMRTYADDIVEFGYTAYVVDFTGVDENTCHERNENRETLRVVPPFVIERFYDIVDNNPVPDIYEVVSPNDAADIIYGE